MSSRYKVLVCGGRNFADRDTVFGALDLVRAAAGEVTVIQGGAAGADALAREWCARQPSVHMINEPADWKAHGKAAGPIRNQRMLDEHRPDMVIAFAGGRGTFDMIRRAEAAGVPVFAYRVEGEFSMSASPWHQPNPLRNERQYQAGRRAYEAGAKYNFHANVNWQRGFRDARDSATGVDRNRVVVGGDLRSRDDR